MIPVDSLRQHARIDEGDPVYLGELIARVTATLERMTGIDYTTTPVPVEAEQVALMMATYWYENPMPGAALPGELRDAIRALVGPVIA
jgi:hypothetical protein